MSGSIPNGCNRLKAAAGCFRLLLCLVFASCVIGDRCAAADPSELAQPILHVPSCTDFEVNGQGDAQQWQRAEWVSLKRRPGGQLEYNTRFKMLYSPHGIYVLFDGTDTTLTANMTQDFLDLWNEDVYECFFWTDEKYPLYLEYEISPLGYELPILIPNLDGKYLGWRPWHYEKDRKTRKQVVIRGGQQMPHAKVTGWRAEIFFPYGLFKPLGNVPPQAGTRWRANFYRVDHDGERATAWDWARVGPSFHEYKKFGTLIFD